MTGSISMVVFFIVLYDLEVLNYRNYLDIWIVFDTLNKITPMLRSCHFFFASFTLQLSTDFEPNFLKFKSVLV